MPAPGINDILISTTMVDPNYVNTTGQSSVTRSDTAQAASSTGIPVVTSVAENVSTFLNGIRATFRQDNVNVSASIRNQRSTTKDHTHDG